MAAIRGILFDKDGTLFDFMATWGSWTRRLALDLAEGSEPRAAGLADAIGFEFATGSFRPESPVIAHTPEEIADELLPHLPGWDRQSLVDRMNLLSAAAEQVPAVPLRPLLGALRARGLKLGVVTNDAEAPARAHLARAAVIDLFDFVAGSDSGYGAKPLPGPLLAFAGACGIHPEGVVMVGDSRHDLVAGKAARMLTVGVLTGLAGARDLAPLADEVLPDIGHLPAWLDRQTGGSARA